MARINPIPGVYLGGYGDMTKTGDGKTNAVVDELTIDWGRQSEVEDVRASVVNVKVWVPNADLAFLQGSNVLGQDLILRWDHGTTRFVIFQGRVSGYKIRRSIRPRFSTTLGYGFLVTLTASDRIADLANVVHGVGNLSGSDTMIIRANLIKNNANNAGVGLNGVYFEPQTKSWGTGQYPTQGTTLRQWTDLLYSSLGNWWTFCHDQASIRGIRRWANPAPRKWYVYRQAHAKGWDMVTVRPDNVAYDSVTYESAVMPGRECYFQGEEELDSGTQSMVNFIQTKYRNSTGADQSRDRNDAGTGRRRAFRFESWLRDTNVIDQVMSDLRALFIYNMFPPKLPPITWDTSRGGGFLSLANAKCMTRAYENPGEIVIGGSSLTAILSANNQIQANGGQIKYIRDHWEITVNPKWCGNFSKQNAIPWTNMPNVPWDSLDPGITGYDLYDVPSNTVYEGEA